MAKRLSSMIISGREFKAQDFKLIKEIVSLYPTLSRTELSKTISEILCWYQSDGEPKWIACMTVLEKLEFWDHIKLPKSKENHHKGTHHIVKITHVSDPGKALIGKINEYGPIKIEDVFDKKSSLIWREYVERYHYLGDKSVFGSQLKYFVSFESGELLGCLQFSASAWSIANRDKWIGWNSRQKSKNLHLIISNSRFLIFPWIKLKNLASKILSLAIGKVPDDWEKRYRYRPIMFETFVDKKQFKGTCYRAANWHYLGITKGRGRMDRQTKYLSSPKDIYVYPLRRNFRDELCREVNN